jgi:hypothetical protein
MQGTLLVSVESRGVRETRSRQQRCADEMPPPVIPKEYGEWCDKEMAGINRMESIQTKVR